MNCAIILFFALTSVCYYNSATSTCITSGSIPDTTNVVYNRSCYQNLNNPVPRVFVITWNDGTTSTITVSLELTYVNLVLQVNAPGSVTAGRFVGNNVLLEFVLVDASDGCLTTGASHYNGTAILTIGTVLVFKLCVGFVDYTYNPPISPDVNNPTPVSNRTLSVDFLVCAGLLC